MLTNDYLSTGTDVTPSIYINGTAGWSSDNSLVSFNVKQATGLNPILYFKYIKKKFGILEKMKLDSRLKNIEKAFNVAVEGGQNALAEKILNQVVVAAREAVIASKGIKFFIEKDDLNKHKYKIRDGKISDTKFEDYTRIIPKKVLAKKKKVEDAFDGFIIYHYWDEKIEKRVEKKQKMSESEKNKMKDPVLFGIIKENNRMYHIESWDDELCDLSFEEIIDVIGSEEKDITIDRNPKFKL